MRLRILDQSLDIDCAPGDQRRLADLAAALESKLIGVSGDTVRRLTLVALSLLDEAQATGAALARARLQIERLTDMVLEPKFATRAPASLENSAAGSGRCENSQAPLEAGSRSA